MSDTPYSIDAATRTAIVERLLTKILEHYIFPDVAVEMEQLIRTRMGNGDYDTITGGEQLAQALTADLQELSHDKHLSVFYSTDPRPVNESEQETEEERAERLRFGRMLNFGFSRVERLPGNIGYLDLRGFFQPAVAGETAVSAMNFLAHTSALIIDLRKNTGGSPEMIALLTSYLFDDTRVHLNNLYLRTGDFTEQYWTSAYVPGARFGGTKPVYVLTSGLTFSAGEEFTYNLKNLRRATIIGETTGGGAHPVRGFPLDEHLLAVIPNRRAISPITGTNWEGTGVTPDIAVPQEDALRVAQIDVLTKMLAAMGDAADRVSKQLREEVRQELVALNV